MAHAPRHLRRHRPSIALVALGIVFGAGACGSDDAGVTVRRADEGTGAPDISNGGGDGDGSTTNETDAATDSLPDGGAPLGTGIPLDPSAFGADLPAVLAQLGFPASFPLPESYSPSDVVGIRVDQSVAFGDPEVEYEVAITQPAPEDEQAFFDAWLGRFDEQFDTGGEVGHGSSDNGTIESVFHSVGFPDSESGSWDIWITRPIGTTSGNVTVGVTASFHSTTFVPLALSPDVAPELPDMSTCTTASGDVQYRAYDDVTNGPDDHGYRVTVDLQCPGTAVLDATTTWVTDLEAAGAGGEVHVGDGYANVSNLVASDGLTYGFDTILADDGSGNTAVHVRIERPV